MTIAVTTQQSFIRPGFSAQFLQSQPDRIFQGSVGCTTQHESYLIDPGVQRSPHLTGAALDQQAKPIAA
jgi:hypothetical protein